MSASEPQSAAQWLALLAWWTVVLTVPAALALALLLRRRYVRAVVRLQSLTASTEWAVQARTGEVPLSVPTNLTIKVCDLGRIENEPAIGSALQLRRRVLRAQFVAGLVYWWAVLVCIYWAAPESAKSEAPVAPGIAWLGWPLVLAPAVVAWAFQVGVSNRVIWIGAAAFGSALSIAFAINADNGLIAGIGIGCVSLLALMGVAFLSPSARGAGPTLVAILAHGWIVFLGLLAGLVFALPGRLDGSATAFNSVTQAALLALALLAAIGASWLALKRIVRNYEAKQCSEQQVALGAYWGLTTLAGLAVVLSMSLNQGGGDEPIWAALTVLACWAAFRLLIRAWLRLIVRRAAPPLPPLLLLRVFKSVSSQAFLDRFLARWRFAASVWMIGGPDLAGAQMEPSEFFAFLQRRLGQLFVQSAEELRGRIERLDDARDPDGRLRVSEIFCSRTTWQPMVLALMERAAVVVLDLRQYNASHTGTRFEIYELINVAPIEKVVVLIDQLDDEHAIASELRAAWNAMLETSPNRSRDTHEVRVLRMHVGSAAEVRGLVNAVAFIASRSRRAEQPG